MSSDEADENMEIVFIKEELDETFNEDWTQEVEKAPNLLNGDPLFPDGEKRLDKTQISRKNKRSDRSLPSCTDNEGNCCAANITDENSPGILCFYCDFKCPDQRELTEHERTHALNSKMASFQCHACEARFINMDDMKLHAKLRHTVKCYPCKICGEVFRRVDRLRKHMSGSHVGVRPYPCTECDLKFSSSSGLNKHAKLHQGKQYSCDVCDAKFAYPSKLRTHILIHTGEKPFACELCEQKFTQKIGLKNHMTSHTGDKPFACDQCEMKFYNSYKLKLHAKTHSFDQPHVCGMCNTRFKHVSSLRGHMRTVHSDAKPFKCEECGACFARKSVLKVHIITHTGEKRFECDQCEAKYGDYTSLKRHRMSIHEGVKPYLCAKCGAGFMRDRELQKHVKHKHSENN
ncbi:hypothetical protein LSTR_LSTR007596 [Laodelphax striatellus]|uniref:C2H2-type domain-containing protein n=1 Tax=Laodelphax striatellus TaxID=195883 RepID=A0A482XLQ4_LAOST|nr:hypothetical protein LSTR_LSTR007596 [Laodelphax striatellus]